MTRMRVWLLTALVALALGFNFGLLSPRIAQSAEETVRGRLAAASSAVRAQLELRDARFNPKLAANSPDLIDSLRPPADPTLPVPKPDEKALRAAAAAGQPTEPDLLIVATGDGAAWSRRGKAAVLTDDVKDLPLVKAALDGSATGPSFVQFDGSLFRVQAARIPGSVGVVVAGLQVDDRFAGELRAAADAEVTIFHDGQIVASSLPEQKRGEMLAWVKTPGPGYGVLPLRLLGLGSALDGKLPRGAQRYAVRVASVSLEGGVMAALTISTAPHFQWLARYQAYYGLAFLAFLLFGLIWGLLPGEKPKVAETPAAPPRPITIPISDRVALHASRAEATLAGANDPAPSPTPPPPGDLPWTERDSSEGEPAWANLGQSATAKKPTTEKLEPAPGADAAPAAPVKGESAASPAPAPIAVEPPAPPAPAESKAAEASKAEVESKASASEAAATEPSSETPAAPSAQASATSPASADGHPAPPPPSMPEAVASEASAPSPFTELDPAMPIPAAASAEGRALEEIDPFAMPPEPEAKTPPPSTPPDAESGSDSQAELEARAEDERTAAAPSEPPPATESPFSFGSLLDEPAPAPARAEPEPAPVGPIPLTLIVPEDASRADESEDHERTTPGTPSESLLSHARGEDETQFPGDEPTRIEAVSAALLDKLREKDPEEPEHSHASESAEHAQEAGHAQAGENTEHAHEAEHAHPDESTEHAQESEHAHQGESTEHAQEAHYAESSPTQHAHEAPLDQPLLDEPAADADEAHFQDTYRQFVELRVQTGEPADKVSYDKFVAKLRKNREELLAKHNARGVKFSVYLKDGRAAIKASAIR